MILNMKILDLNGKVVLDRELQIMQGSNQLSFDCSDFAGGVYVLHLANAKGRISQEFVKK